MLSKLKAVISNFRSIFFSSLKSTLSTALFVLIVVSLLLFLWHQMKEAQRVSLPRGQDAALTPGLSAVPVKDARQILVLNSYHMGYSWSDNEMEGIVETLQKIGPNIQPVVDYLDCKRFPKMEHFEKLKELFIQKYRSRDFSLVIVADNPAFEFALKYRPQIFPHATIVFCGINGFNKGMISGQENVTGVAELLDAEGTMKLALMLHPKTREVVVIHDYTITGLSTRRETEEQLRPFGGKVAFRFMENLSTGDLMERLRALSPESLVLALSYSLDKDGQVINHEKIAKLLSTNSPVPVYGLHEERLGYGIVGGNLLGGKLQGVRAAEMALLLLSGKSASQVPVDTKSPTRMMFDYNQLARFSIPVSSLPDESVIVNQPLPFFRQYRGVVITTLAVFSTLILGILILGFNIYQRRAAEQALLDSERNFRTLFESAGDAIFIEDMTGRFLEVNDEAWKRMGYSRTELLGLSMKEISSPEFHDSLSGVRMTLSEEGRTYFESQHVTKAGTVIPVELSSRLIDFSGKPAILSIARDISERKRAEENQKNLHIQLLHAQKMESIGRLAGGVAHDFNNILTSILGYCEMLLLDIPDGEPMKKQVRTIQKAGERAVDLTRQLLAFGRKQVLEMKVLNVKSVIESMAKMISRVIGEDISLELHLDEVRNCAADPGQLDQVLMNLVLNARDSMPSGGKLMIGTENAVLSEEYVKAHEGLAPGDYVMISVSDSGKGISRELQEKIFEPFFTTKEKGKGTGLGLATVYGIVRQHRGHIYLDSEQEKGTTFKIYLPATPESASEDELSAASPLYHGTETILVVDDEPMIVELVQDVLQSLGYTVLTATGGHEALRISEGYRGRIDLLLSDVIMPAMNGRELSDAISRQRPGIETVFMSGYTSDIIAHHGVLDPGVVLAQKPITPRQLAKTIYEVLHKRA